MVKGVGFRSLSCRGSWVQIPPPALTMENSRGSFLVNVVFDFSKDFATVVVFASYVFKSSFCEDACVLCVCGDS
jgi:hypothetical protein